MVRILLAMICRGLHWPTRPFAITEPNCALSY
uniref:Uncharacterized protein n=1 Tax=Anguilla anguilla TaxID=7936 RepID=A0A0E9TX94_ANGAN